MTERKPQPAAADVGAPSDIAGDDVDAVTGPSTDDPRPEPGHDDPDRTEHSDAGTTRGGGAGGPEPPPA